jgi:hypothetical protein
MKKHDLDTIVGKKIELSGIIAATYSIPPNSIVSFTEGSFFQGKFIHEQTLYNNDLVPKKLNISTSGKLSLVAVELELLKVAKASKRASINYIKSEAEKEAIAEVLAELEAEDRERIKKKILMDKIRIEVEKEALAEVEKERLEEAAALEVGRKALPESDLTSSSKPLIKLDIYNSASTEDFDELSIVKSDRSPSVSGEDELFVSQELSVSALVEERLSYQASLPKESAEEIISAEVTGDSLDISVGA